MGLLTVEGIYKNGKVELSEQPKLSEDSTRVLVTFLQATEIASPGKLDRDELHRRVFARMREGIDLGVAPHPTRQDQEQAQ